MGAYRRSPPNNGKLRYHNYLSFNSHHPLSHRLSVVRTLVGRAEALSSTVEDRDKELEHLSVALQAQIWRKQLPSFLDMLGLAC